MYANNVFSKRRPTGWAERRRHFRRLMEQTPTKTKKPEAARKADPDEKP